MASGGKRAGAGRPKNDEASYNLQMRIPAKYKDEIIKMVRTRLVNLEILEKGKEHGFQVLQEVLPNDSAHTN